jgi:chromosome segregation ATPase
MDPNNCDEEKVPTIMIKEFSNAMFNVLEEYQKNCKGPAKYDTLAEFIIESNFVNDDEKIDFKNEKKYFSYILAFTQNLKDVYFAAEIEKARIKQNETQVRDRQLKEQKASLEKKLESIQKEIEKLRPNRSELELKLDQYERQKHNIDAEFESDLKLKEMELQYKNKALETELEETESLLIS